MRPCLDLTGRDKVDVPRRSGVCVHHRVFSTSDFYPGKPSAEIRCNPLNVIYPSFSRAAWRLTAYISLFTWVPKLRTFLRVPVHLGRGRLELWELLGY